MQWQCKYCEFITGKRGYLLKHYRLKHGSDSRTVPFPCLHQECLCTFNSINALKVHLSKIHQKAQDTQLCETALVTFHCHLCDFSAPCTDAVFFTHLRSTHLKVHHRVHCPYKGCNFYTNVYSTFNAHISKQHRTDNWRMFKTEIVSGSGTHEIDQEASDEVLSDTLSTADTDILSTSSQERQKPWPELFDIPQLSVDVEYRLRQADLLHLRDRTHLKVSKELKHDILERLAESMYSFTAYPNNAQYESVAAALISKHPCLQEQGSTSRCSGWKNSLKYKMANYRTKRRRSGCFDVTVNAGKRGGHSTGEPANKNIKKAKKGELNYLPNFPEGFDQATLEGCRKDLVDEMLKRTPNGQLVKQKMDLTFALRRKEVVESEPAIHMMLERWPALFTEDQVCMEFNRIVGKNLKQEFYESLDRHSHRLINIFQSKRGNVGQLLAQLSEQTKTKEPTDVRTLVLRGLPVILGDSPTDFYKPAFDSDDDDSFRNVEIGILLVEKEGAVCSSSLHLSPVSLKIIVEGQVVMDNIQDLPNAMCLLFGLAYALHLNYPKSMKLTFQFIQQVLLTLGNSELKPRLQTLKNQLAM